MIIMSAAIISMMAAAIITDSFHDGGNRGDYDGGGNHNYDGGHKHPSSKTYTSEVTRTLFENTHTHTQTLPTPRKKKGPNIDFHIQLSYVHQLQGINGLNCKLCRFRLG